MTLKLDVMRGEQEARPGIGPSGVPLNISDMNGRCLSMVVPTAVALL